MRIVLLTCLALALCAAEDPVAAFSAAMSGQDQAAKKAAIRGLLSLPKEQDDQVLGLLAGAVDDRQASQSAVSALRSRTGLAPSPKRGAGGYPAYPPEDSAAAWNAWIAARKADLDTKKAAKDIKDKLEKIDEKINPDAPTGDPATDGGDAVVRAPQKIPAPDDLGGLDRIHFQNGSTLLGYVISKRTDADGKLVSIRVVHRDGAGEESIAADLIARVDEDIP